MLPFLKPKQQTGVIVDTRKPDQNQEPADDQDAPLKACAQDLIHAASMKDVEGFANALKAAFEILQSQPPQEEGPEPMTDMEQT